MKLDTTPRPTLEEEISIWAPAAQDLFAKILESHCREGESGISAICENLGIHRKLAWQIRNIAYSPDIFRAVSFMPSRTGIISLIKACQSDNNARDLAEKLLEISESFERIINMHTGDRKSLEIVLESFTTSPASVGEMTEVKLREKAYLGNSFIWGAQANTQLSISILNKSASKDNWLDIAQIRSLIGLRRVRPNVYWLVGQSVVLDDQQSTSVVKRMPIDAEAATEMNGAPIIPTFCSQPVPQIRRRQIESGFINDELLPAPVGFTGQQTVVIGEVIRELSPAYATPQNRVAHFGSLARTPCEVYILDHFVHRDLFPDVEREMCVFGELNSPVTISDEDLLPVSESITHLGRGAGVARTVDVPGYMEMLRWIFNRLNWDQRAFELYRIRIAFPPIPSSVMIRHDLPEESR